MNEQQPKLFKMKLFVGLISIAFSTFSCTKKCDCNQTYDPTITYKKGDLVSYDGKCWIAKTQGKNIEPGPWLQNGNDIWELCD